MHYLKFLVYSSQVGSSWAQADVVVTLYVMHVSMTCSFHAKHIYNLCMACKLYFVVQFCQLFENP